MLGRKDWNRHLKKIQLAAAAAKVVSAEKATAGEPSQPSEPKDAPDQVVAESPPPPEAGDAS